MAEQFCLRWNNFQTNIMTALDSLKSSEDLVDVTLTCEGKNIKAHKVVLSACSPYFRSVFKENPCQHPIIILKDVLAEDILYLLSYMYQGEVFIEENKLSSFLHTAALLQIKGLCGEQNEESNLLLENPLSHALRRSHCNQITISPKLSLRDVPVSTVKRRRNSATDRFSDITFRDHNKKYKSNQTESEVLPMIINTSINSSSHLQEGDYNVVDKMKAGTGQKEVENIQTESIPKAVAVKHELDEENSIIGPTDPLDTGTTVKGDQSDVALPHLPYENSMLARSLISGAHSLKCDASSGNLTAKISHKPDICSGQRPREVATSSIPTLKKIVLFKNPILSSEDQLKKEQLSPKSDSMEYEPEIMLSENDLSVNINMGSIHLAGQNAAQQQVTGSPSASTSQSGLQIHNHAAICGDCPHCGTKYSNQSALKYHVRLMHSDLTNRLCCYLCPRSFTLRDLFKEHMWTSHGQRN